MNFFRTRIRSLILFFPLFISGCGQASHQFIEPKAVPAPLPHTANLSSIAVDTAMNVLHNSLLEAILLLIAVILFMRYKASSEKMRLLKEKNGTKNFNDFVDYKSSFDYSNWHFNEEKHK